MLREEAKTAPSKNRHVWKSIFSFFAVLDTERRNTSKIHTFRKKYETISALYKKRD
ncbi:hypothetical protein FUSO6_00895 [Fusobacterium necrophorum DAB]|uniref:Uncharacterized protein n=2 Tax=Fusobacterium necrophorum TaxID=859 RepID=A0AB73BZG3_9FUSO|nr:hypothetical protein FUSO3_00765 [Fusobacterium necrophorum BL]KDE67361.1 hypothetical protein FUSO5_00090 [Fusobacterium necrophorum BFTR-1]KDE71441.1 hypothetical protein FUSO6_00895 [Fusobacterium necrophorum DAB]KDE72987.1 hypothetical protein FUSO8_02885 [Fusobacterium necrophorum DJ-2]KDE74103.1 hypothetical protein FUSO7_04610 [Fusobacterium necrophorum BFTR-2]